MTYFIKCWIGAFLLVAFTVNPTGRSYLHWVEENPQLPASIVLLTTFILCLGYAFYIREFLKNVGGRGLILFALFFYIFIWVLLDYEVIYLGRSAILDWLFVFITSFILALGPSWKRLF